MLSSRLTNCPECANIPSILRKIDCKLAELGNNLYNNISYMLNKSIPASDIIQLIGYKRILTYKYYNPSYLCEYSVNSIASKAIRLTTGCVSRCNTPEPCLVELCNIEVVPNTPSTTTTTTTCVICCDVLIGTQTWTSCNLDVTTYRDGTPIPEVTDPTAWTNLTTGAWCYYDNDQANGAIYGKLYNWYAVAGIYDVASFNDPLLRKQLAPLDYHVPTDAEWTTLTTFLGGNTIAGGAMKETGTTHWESPNTGATNSSGFTGLPGSRFNGDSFDYIGLFSYWWSSSEYDPSTAWYRGMEYNFVNAFRYSNYKKNGYSVRLVQD